MSKAERVDEAGTLTKRRLSRSPSATASAGRSTAPSRQGPFFEPDWRSRSAAATSFTRASGVPVRIAGLWDRWRDAAGPVQERYTMLTINTDDGPIFRICHQAGKKTGQLTSFTQERLFKKDEPVQSPPMKPSETRANIVFSRTPRDATRKSCTLTCIPK